MKYTLKELVAEVKREIADRGVRYKEEIACGKLKREEAVEYYHKMQAVLICLENSCFESIEFKKKGN